PLRPWRRNWPNLQGLVNKLKNGRWPTERLSVGQRPFPIYKGYSSTYGDSSLDRNPLAIDIFSNRAQNLCDLSACLALRLTHLRKHWLDLGFKQRHDIGKHACKLIRLTRRLCVTSRRIKDFYAQGLWATTSGGKVEFDALALHQLLNAFRKDVPADIDIFISRIRDKAKTLFSVKPLNFADWHWAHHFPFNREKDILPRI